MQPETYRPWISEDRESHLTDLAVLESLADGSKTPFGIAGGRHRVSTVRVQCHYLKRLGYVNQTSIDTYSLTANGVRAIEEHDRFETEYVRLGEELKLDYEHVTALGELLNAETIIEINKQFFKTNAVSYETTDSTLHDIESIRDGRLERLTIEFPRFEPLTHQLAHTVRTFCGHHPFPDANHRTGTHIADILASKQGHDLFSLIQEDAMGITRAVETSKILRGLCSNVRNSVDYLWMKDELFYHWDRYFRDLLYDVTPAKRVHTQTGDCQYDNLTSNERVSLLYRFAIRELDEMRAFFEEDEID
ncbi:Fic family protein [Halomicrobium sp. LC1Hm]|uniref:Fic family protein n=1 Tax=Halomicrobium sp. LC1Hm TaxID=2610902 RepID=UPI0021001525|nr:Fic family protein [Halomicrobium sp. LC1Hm]